MQDIDTDDFSENEDESKVVQIVDKYFSESAGYRKTFETDWKEYDRFAEGEQWAYSEKRPVKNHVRRIIEGQLPLLTSARPSVDVIPVEASEESFNKAKMLSSALSFVFEKQSLQLKNGQLFRSLLKTGTAYFYVDYDPDQKAGFDIPIKELNWRHCFPDPNATNIDDCMYFGIKMPMREIDVIRRFPAFKKEIKEKGSDRGAETNKINEYIKPDRWDGYGGYKNEGKSYQLNDMVDYEEMWHKDYSTVPVDPEQTTAEIAKEAEEVMSGKVPDISLYEDHVQHIAAHEQLGPLIIQQAASLAFGLPVEELTENDLMQAAQFPEVVLSLQILADHIEAHKEYAKINPTGEMPKYKNNLRLTIKINALVLFDGPAPVEDGLIPIAPAYCYKDGLSFFGTGDIKLMIDSQREHNELGWFELQGLAINSNQTWLVDEEAQVDADTITNDPGLIIKKRKDGNVVRLPPGQVSDQLAIKQNVNVREMEGMAGLPEASQGEAPAGFTAARAVIALQQAGNGRSNLKSQNYKEYTLPRLAKLVLSRIIKYWNTDRLLQIYDDNGKIQFIKFEPIDVENFEYDIKVVQGSSLGYDKGQLFDFMSSLVESGKIPPRVLFQVSDVPYRSRILEELEKEDQKNLAIQQLQEQILQYQALLQPVNEDQGKK